MTRSSCWIAHLPFAAALVLALSVLWTVHPVPARAHPTLPCAGDCDAMGSVPVVELATALNVALGTLQVYVVFFIIVGFRVARQRAPEIVQVAQTDSPLQMVFALAEPTEETLHIFFKRPLEGGGQMDPNVVYVSFYHPRQGIPPRVPCPTTTGLPIRASPSSRASRNSSLS